MRTVAGWLRVAACLAGSGAACGRGDRIQGTCYCRSTSRCVGYSGYSVASLNTVRGPCRVLTGDRGWTEGGDGFSRDGEGGEGAQTDRREAEVTVFYADTVEANRATRESWGGSFSTP
jgi:hypothetical protein